jgi:hypothetical protein
MRHLPDSKLAPQSANKSGIQHGNKPSAGPPSLKRSEIVLKIGPCEGPSSSSGCLYQAADLLGFPGTEA